jgi:homoserine O-acetyltransferase
MTDPQDAFLDIPDFTLSDGTRLPARIAYVTLGRLDAGGRNAILVTHGFTGSHRFVLPGDDASETSWSGLVGPGRAIDTDRWFVVSSNALGSSYGTTGPGSIDPSTGRPWGIDFPAISFADVVALQRRLLDALGVARLHAVVGVSMGGYQTLQWGLQYPDHADRLVVALSAFARSAGGSELRRTLSAHPGWNGGHPAPGAMAPMLARMRKEIMRAYGMDAWLADRGLDAEARERELRRTSDDWARDFDPVSMLALREMIDRFDARPHLARIRARVLLMLCTSDVLFPAGDGPAMLARLHADGVRAELLTLESRYGHLASGLDWAKWAERLAAFLREPA